MKSSHIITLFSEPPPPAERHFFFHGSLLAHGVGFALLAHSLKHTPRIEDKSVVQRYTVRLLSPRKTESQARRSAGKRFNRAFVRFETAPGEQAQMDWGHFGNWGGKRLYGFALTLCWSRMQYVEFTQRQDAETLLNCMVHALTYCGGVTATVLTT
jgi:Integrase core domain